MNKSEFREYVRGYYARASFPDYHMIHQIVRAVLELQHADHINRICALKLQFKGRQWDYSLTCGQTVTHIQSSQ
jgi:hypothetical protein